MNTSAPAHESFLPVQPIALVRQVVPLTITASSLASSSTRSRPARATHCYWRMRPEAHRSQPWMDRQMRKVCGSVAEIARRIGDQDYAIHHRFGPR